MAEEQQQKKDPHGIWERYEVKGDSLTRKNKFSPKAGKGYFMANHKDRRTCGHSGYTEFVSGEKKDTEGTKTSEVAHEKQPTKEKPETSTSKSAEKKPESPEDKPLAEEAPKAEDKKE